MSPFRKRQAISCVTAPAGTSPLPLLTILSVVMTRGVPSHRRAAALPAKGTRAADVAALARKFRRVFMGGIRPSAGPDAQLCPSVPNRGVIVRRTLEDEPSDRGSFFKVF